MARIEGIRLRLENWAAWSARRDGGGLGYARVNVLAKMGAPGGRGGYREAVIPIDDVGAAETDAAVQSLLLDRPHLHQVLTLHYQRGLELDRVAQTMRRALSTIKRNLEDADAALQQWFVARAESRRVR